jgi:hypothetical protein
MARLLSLHATLTARPLRSRRDLLLENLALRQQLAVLTRRHPQPRLAAPDRLFWVILRRIWSGWRQALLIVQPETVVRWHRAGFKRYWKWISHRKVHAGRRPTSQELRELIFRMVIENPMWRAPRIHGELKMLGFDLSERTVLRWMRKAPRNPQPATRWAAFLSNHRDAFAAMDFFTVPTLTFGVLYCFFMISHQRRRILHFNATRHSTGAWVSQQLRQAFPYDCAARYLILDGERNACKPTAGEEPRDDSLRRLPSAPWRSASWLSARRLTALLAQPFPAMDGDSQNCTPIRLFVACPRAVRYCCGLRNAVSALFGRAQGSR